jgi:hypothetical protein
MFASVVCTRGKCLLWVMRAHYADEMFGVNGMSSKLILNFGDYYFTEQVLVRTAYDTLGLQTYFTSGPTETRAWTIRKGSTAPQVCCC